MVARTVEGGEVVRAGLRIDEVVDLSALRPEKAEAKLGRAIDSVSEWWRRPRRRDE